MRIGRITLALCAAAALGGCTIQDQKAPDITGPSSFGVSFIVTASSTTIARDGAAQSTITVQARNVSGEALANQRILLSATGPTGTVLSADEVTTDGRGVATVSVTAPPSTSVGNVISVDLRPVDALGQPTQFVPSFLIGLTPSNASAPVAAFTFSPSAPGLNEAVTFNASTSTDEGTVCGACTYLWEFGDGDTASGVVVTKTFTTTGVKTVTLRVTDAGGAISNPVTQSLNVGQGTITANIVFSPTNPRPGDTVQFDGRSSVLSGGAAVTSYEWDFGNGSTASGPTASTTFSSARTYTVRLTIRDSLGRTATTTITVTVAT